MKVSVIIPFFSNVGWLDAAVESVLNQSITDYEVIVINDGSNEDMESFLGKFNERIKYIQTENKGSAAARNLGIEYAVGKYIAFLDSDDIWFKDRLKEQIDFMEKKEAVWCHCSYELFSDQTKENVGVVNVSAFEGDVFGPCLVSSPIGTPCVIVLRDVFINDDTLRFAEHMRQGQDSYLWLRLAEHYKLYVLDRILVGVRMRIGGNTSSSVRTHIRVKSLLYEYINKQIHYNNRRFKSINYFTLIGYKLCYKSNSFIESLKQGSVLKNEYIISLFYVVPFLIFKCVKKIKYRKFYENKR